MAREPKNEVVDDVIKALDALTYEQLLRVAEAASKTAETKKLEAKQALIAEFQSRAATLGLSLVETTSRRGRGAGGGRKAAPAAAGPKEVKYRHEGNEWHGRGPRPKWLNDLTKAGRSIEEFKV